MRVVLFISLFFAGMANPGPMTQDPNFVIGFDCGSQACVIVKADLYMLLKQNTEFYERAEALQKQIDAAKPKCAELTVTEPSKQKPPPIKVERDS